MLRAEVPNPGVPVDDEVGEVVAAPAGEYEGASTCRPPYDEGLGVHDIHYNQGDPPGEFQHLDAIWQDGGTIIEQPTGELTAFLTKFKPQALTTDANGLPL